MPKHHPSADDDSWMEAPKADGTIMVDYRYNLHRLAAIDTVNGSAYVDVRVVLYWTDERLIDWKGDLPPKLWGPKLRLANAADLNMDQVQFELVDPATGRIKRGVDYDGNIVNPMDIRVFPFDMDDVRLNFETASTWETLDGSRMGRGRRGQRGGETYELRPVCEENEGELIDIQWVGSINEWNLLGVSTRLVKHETNSANLTRSNPELYFHISRKWAFYFWRALLPLWTLSTLAFNCFRLDVADQGNRQNLIATYFLAAFAMLYVVGESLPRPDFLTKVDQIITLSTSFLAFQAIVFSGLAHIHEEEGADEAKKWNDIIAVGSIAFYIAVNCWVFPWAFFTQYNNIKKLRDYRSATDTEYTANPMIDTGPAAIHREAHKTLPTVQAGAQFFSLKELHPEVYEEYEGQTEEMLDIVA